MKEAIKKLELFKLITSSNGKIKINYAVSKTLILQHNKMEKGRNYIKYLIGLFKSLLDVERKTYDQPKFGNIWLTSLQCFLRFNFVCQEVMEFLTSRLAKLFYLFTRENLIENLIYILETIQHKLVVKRTKHSVEMRYWTARCYLEIKDNSKAIDIYKQLIPEENKLYLKNHRFFLRSNNNLAVCYYEKKKIS